MLFNSVIFLFAFLPLALLGYQAMARFGRRPRLAWIVFTSIVFYGWWDWRFVFVLLGSMLLNFCVSRLIASSSSAGRKNFWMVVGIVLNLAGLGFFKYLFPLLNFFHAIGIGAHDWKNMVLPLGISFFTFTQIGYLVDLSQGEAEAQGFVEYALFVSFFPHLIAGPIIHHREMMPQFNAERDGRLQIDDVLFGMSWFIVGLAKKCLVADHLAPSAQNAFASAQTLGALPAWVGLVVYSLQLYFDFSGYSDMAIGLARMFSIEFPINFDSPYKAANIAEYWQRWHMTLTRYLTLYLYNPISLAVNRRRLRAGKKISRKAAQTLPGFLSMIAWPTVATMFLIGIWHGAGIQFIVFGVLHGLYLTVHQAWKQFRKQDPNAVKGSFARVGPVLLTYFCVLLAQVFFRANSLSDAIHYFGGMAGLRGLGDLHPLGNLGPAMAAVFLFVVWFFPNTQEIFAHRDFRVPSRALSWLTWKPCWQWSVALGMLFFASLVLLVNGAAFLYFQF